MNAGSGADAGDTLTNPAPAPRLWQLTPDRVEEWRSIRQAALADTPEAFDFPAADAASMPPHLDLADALARLAQAEIWAAGDRIGTPLAVAGWEPGWTPGTERTGWISSVYTSAPARGRGLALTLLARLAARAGAAGMTRLGLHVGMQNLPARRLYARAGFRPLGAPFVNDIGITEIAMTCDLPAP